MSADPQKSQSNLDNPVEIVICRTFAAPRELVWKAWTDPNHASRWWGPAGFTTTTHASDFRPGGAWRYTMHGPDGHDYKNKIVYIEIDRPARLVYKHSGEEEFEPVNFQTEVTFEALGERGENTKVTMRSIFPTAQERDFVINNYGAVEGGKQHLANLEDYLASMSAGSDHESLFSISHVCPASREKVWLAWTEVEQLKRWFGPQGSSMPQATLDFRVGGMFHYRMSHPNGMEMWGRWIFQTIDRPNKLEFVSSFSNANGEVTPAPFPGLDDFPPELLTTVTFVDHAGIGQGTLVTVVAQPVNGTKAQLDFFTAFRGSMRQGWSGALQQLVAHLGN